MNFNCTKVLLRCTSIFAKNHFRKFTRQCSNAAQRYYTHRSIYTRHFCSSTDKTNGSEFEDFDQFEESQPNYTDIDSDAVTDGDPKKLRLLKLYQLELDILAQQGEQVPKRMTTDFWRQLIEIPSKYQRLDYLKFLWLNEMKEENFKLKKLRRREKRLEGAEERQIKYQERLSNITTSSPVEYGLTSNALFNRIRDQRMNRFYNYKVLQAMWFGPHILVDCGYENFMSFKEISLCAKQVLLMWSDNRDYLNPFDIQFCNLERSSPMLRKLCKTIPNIDDDPSFPFNYTSKNYLDLYPKEQLVYLTPHCNETLDKYDGNSVYIIGALVDKTRSEPLSLAKAKRDGIRVAKFPLDNHLQWGIGVKSLTLNQCLAIMNDLKDTQDWSHAFRHIPKRKLVRDFIDQPKIEFKTNKFTNKHVREKFRRNMVYDMLLKDSRKKNE